jgi:hypothetical protein
MTLPKPLSSRERSALLMQHLDAVANDPDYWSPFAKPFNEPPEEETPDPTTAEYYFGYGVGPNNAPSLDEERYSPIFGRIVPPELHPCLPM